MLSSRNVFIGTPHQVDTGTSVVFVPFNLFIYIHTSELISAMPGNTHDSSAPHHQQQQEEWESVRVANSKSASHAIDFLSFVLNKY